MAQKHEVVRSPELFLMVLVLGIPGLAFVLIVITRIRDAQRRRAAVHLAEIERQERDREAGERLYASRRQRELERVRRLNARDDPVIIERRPSARRDPTPKPTPIRRRDDTPVTSTPIASPSPSVSIPDPPSPPSIPDPPSFDPGGGASGGGGVTSDY